MTTQATTIGGTGTRLRPSLEELVDQLIAAMFKGQEQTEPATETLSVAKSLHEARRLRQGGGRGRGAGGPRRHGHKEG